MPTTASQPVTDVPAGVYNIDNSTTVAFTTTHFFGLGVVSGTFALLSGTLHVDDSPEAVTATVSIDPASFHTGTHARDKKVRGKAFLDSRRHPSIDVTVERVDREQDRLTGRGTLTVRATTAPLNIAITDPQVSGDTLRAQLAARIDRYAHGITAVPGVAAPPPRRSRPARRHASEMSDPMTNNRSLHPNQAPWRRVLLLASAAAAATTLVLLAFAYPATSTAPRDLPLAVAGPPDAVAQVQARLDAQDDGAFDVIGVPDRGSAVDEVLERRAYGALVLGAQGPAELITASAASPAVAQLLNQLAVGLSAAGPQPAFPVTDIAPTPADDPRGAGLAAGSLPLTIGGILTGTLMALLVRGARRQAVGALAAATLVGALTVTVLHGWLGSLEGNIWVEAAAVAGGVVAIALLLIGWNALLGRAGLIAVDLALVLLGNPLSGATSAPHLLPSGWSAIGHWMPLGATVDLLRGISSFDGRGTTLPALALAAWAALGLTLLAVASQRNRAGNQVSATPKPKKVAV